MKNFSVLVGLVIILAACNGGLEDGPVDLEIQFIDKCSWQGQILNPPYDGGSPTTDISINCRITRDRYPTVAATVELQRYVPGEGWKDAGGELTKVAYTKELRSGTRDYIWQHLKAYNKYYRGIAHYKCRSRRIFHHNSSWMKFRGKATVFEVGIPVRNITSYYTPTKELFCYFGR